MKNKVGIMTWEACKTCKNQAGPKGCNAGSCTDDMLDFGDLNDNGETDDIVRCFYYVPKQDQD